MDASKVIAAPSLSLPPTVFFRAVTPSRLRHFGTTALDGRWTGHVGGRFNSPGTEATLYLAGCQTVAAFEVEQEALLNNIAASAIAPLVVMSVCVRKAQVVDLTNGLLRKSIGIDKQALLTPTVQWKHTNRRGETTIAQRVGDALRSRNDIDGLLVPSWFIGALAEAADWPSTRTQNLVLFTDNDGPRNRVELLPEDPDGLLP